MSQHLCGVCDKAVRIRKRELSDAAVSTLVLMGALLPVAAHQPMCDVCFAECRELLIEVQGQGQAAVAEERRGATAAHEHRKRDYSDVA